MRDQRVNSVAGFIALKRVEHLKQAPVGSSFFLFQKLLEHPNLAISWLFPCISFFRRSAFSFSSL